MDNYQNIDWKRNFKGEHYYRPLRKIFGQLRRTVESRTRAALLTRQALFIDTNVYYRIGGIDPEKAALYNDVLAIQAGRGTVPVNTLKDQVDLCLSIGKKYFTWWIPDPDSPATMTEQVEEYYSWYGVSAAPMCTDIEPPRSGTRHVNAEELRDCVNRIRQLSNYQQWGYSNVHILENIFGSFFREWFGDVLQWIAQYLFIPGTTQQYRDYAPWLNRYSWSYPPAIDRSPLYSDSRWLEMVKAWQMTSKLDAEKYIAVEWIEPGQPGIKSADGNVSMEPLEVFLSYFGEELPPPPPPPEVEPYFGRLKVLQDVQNVRSEPSTRGGDSTVIGKVFKGDIVEVIQGKENSGIWDPGLYAPGKHNEFWVMVETPSGIIGYIAGLHGGTVYTKSVQE